MNDREQFENLTKKQRETLDAIVDGAGTTAELADALGMSESGARSRVRTLERVAPGLVWTDIDVGNYCNPGLKQFVFGAESEAEDLVEAERAERREAQEAREKAEDEQARALLAVVKAQRAAKAEAQEAVEQVEQSPETTPILVESLAGLLDVPGPQVVRTRVLGMRPGTFWHGFDVYVRLASMTGASSITSQDFGGRVVWFGRLSTLDLPADLDALSGPERWERVRAYQEAVQERAYNLTRQVMPSYGPSVRVKQSMGTTDVFGEE